MSRVKRGVPAHKRRNRVLKRAKGYFGARSKLTTVAREAVEKADLYAYKGRKERKRQFRALWIARINAAAREHSLSYSRFMDGLNKAGVEIDRKVLAQLALDDPHAFAELAAKAREAAA
ncbi:MAG: 50S ribosomal protein L20 [Myxococcota bacterium]|nr:50S ribosomal protein L20 [Myxococcota bacterium]